MKRNIAFISVLTTLFSLIITLTSTAAVNKNTEFNATTEANKESYSNRQVADRQIMGQRDLEITQQIRQQIVNTEMLSYKAQNVKILTENGRVTLKGTVSSANEKSAIEKIANNIAGPGRVSNETVIER